MCYMGIMERAFDYTLARQDVALLTKEIERILRGNRPRPRPVWSSYTDITPSGLLTCTFYKFSPGFTVKRADPETGAETEYDQVVGFIPPDWAQPDSDDDIKVYFNRSPAHGGFDLDYGYLKMTLRPHEALKPLVFPKVVDLLRPGRVFGNDPGVTTRTPARKRRISL